MMLHAGHSLAIVGVTAVCTILIRAFPFLVFGGRKEVPGAVRYLGGSAAGFYYGGAGCILYEKHGFHGDQSLCTIAGCGYSGGGIACVEEKYSSEYRRRNGVLHDAGADGVCIRMNRLAEGKY